MTHPWTPIKPSEWQTTPCIRNRIATEIDVEEARAVFYSEGRSVPADFPLPCCGFQLLEDGSEEPVVVIQAEATPDGILLGVRYLEGGNGVCLADEVRVLAAGFGESLAS